MATFPHKDFNKKGPEIFSQGLEKLKTPSGDEAHPGYCAAEF